MEKPDNKAMDEKAALLHDNYSDNDYSFVSCLDDFNTVYSVMADVFGRDYEDVFSIGFLKAIKTYDHNKGSFKNHLNTVLSSKKKSQYQSDMGQRRKKVGEIIDENGQKHEEYVYFEELDKDLEDEEGKRQDFIADEKEDVERKVHTRLQMERVYLILADLSVEKKKEYSRKKTFCYPPLFFTDLITALQWKTASSDFISANRQKLDEAAELPFANHYLVRECSSVCDIRGNSFKSLSDFTGKESDKGIECGNPKDASLLCLNHSVYTSYVLKTKGKSVTGSNISDHAKKFSDFVKENLKEKGETL